MSGIFAATIPAPIDGINTEQGRDVMDPMSAIGLINVSTNRGILSRRPPIKSYRADLGIPCQYELITYNSPNGISSDILLGFGNGGALGPWQIFPNFAPSLIPGTGSGTIGALNYHVHMRTLASGTLLFLCDGVARVCRFDGTNCDIAGFTIGGVADSNLQTPCVYKTRLFFSKRNSAELYYASLGAITGALNTLEVGPFLQKGGSILWLGTWSGNAGSGLDDFLVVASDRGEILLYTGTDPAVATSWQLVSRFFIPKSNSHHHFIYRNSDVIIFTEQGIFPLSSIVNLGQGSDTPSLANPIKSLYKSIYNYGYSVLKPIIDSELQAILIPVSAAFNDLEKEPGASFVDYNGFLVMDLSSGSWSFFDTSLNSQYIYGVTNFKQKTYFGLLNTVTGKYGVYYFETSGFTNDDENGPVAVTINTSFNYLEDRAHIKRFISVSPTINTYTSSTGKLFIACDNKVYSDSEQTALLNQSTFSYSRDGPNVAHVNQWGRSISIYMYLPTTTYRTSISAFQIIYERGGYA